MENETENEPVNPDSQPILPPPLSEADVASPPPAPPEQPEAKSWATPARLTMYAAMVAFLLAIAWIISRQDGKTGGPGGTRRRTSVMDGFKPSAAEDPILAHVNGAEIRASEFAMAAESIPEQMKPMLQTPVGKKALLEEIVKMKLLEQEAVRLGLDDDPEIKSKMALLRGNLMASAALTRLTAGKPKAEPKQIYEENKQQFESIHGREIVIAYEGGMLPAKAGKAPSAADAKTKAAGAVEQIRSGSKFEDVLKKVSDDPQSVARGGDFGSVTRGQLPSEVENVLFGLQKGQVSDPIQTQFAIHILQALERETKTFEEVRPYLENQAKTFNAEKIIKELRAKAKIEMDEKFFGGEVKPK